MKKRIAIFTRHPSAPEVGCIVEKMSSLSMEPAVVLSPADLNASGLDFDLLFALSGSLSLLLRLEGRFTRGITGDVSFGSSRDSACNGSQDFASRHAHGFPADSFCGVAGGTERVSTGRTTGKFPTDSSVSTQGRLLVLVPPERYQLVRSVLLPSSFVSERLEELMEQGIQYLQRNHCGESVPEYAVATDGLGVALSKREEEVLALLVNGLTNKEVAWKLGISVGTLAAHRRNLYRKTRLSTLSQLVIWGLLHGVGV